MKAIDATVQEIIASPGNRKCPVSLLMAMTITLVKLNPASNGDATSPIDLARALISAPASFVAGPAPGSLEAPLTPPSRVSGPFRHPSISHHPRGGEGDTMICAEECLKPVDLPGRGYTFPDHQEQALKQGWRANAGWKCGWPSPNPPCSSDRIEPGGQQIPKLTAWPSLWPREPLARPVRAGAGLAARSWIGAIRPDARRCRDSSCVRCVRNSGTPATFALVTALRAEGCL